MALLAGGGLQGMQVWFALPVMAALTSGYVALLPEPGGSCHLRFGTVWRLCFTACLVFWCLGVLPSSCL